MGVISRSSNLRHLSSDKKMGLRVGDCWKARVARGRKRERGGMEGGYLYGNSLMPRAIGGARTVYRSGFEVGV